MSGLKPCPFCGGKAEMVEAGTADDVWLVRCTWCQCKTVNHYGKLTPELVWNRRAAIEENDT